MAITLDLMPTEISKQGSRDAGELVRVDREKESVFVGFDIFYVGPHLI